MGLLLPVCAIEGEIAGWAEGKNAEYFPSINKGGEKREIFGYFCRVVEAFLPVGF